MEKIARSPGGEKCIESCRVLAFPGDGLQRHVLSILTTSGGSQAQVPLNKAQTTSKHSRHENALAVTREAHTSKRTKRWFFQRVVWGGECALVPGFFSLRANTLISEPRLSTPCEMRFFPRGKGKWPLQEKPLTKAIFPFSRGKNRISQGVENRGSPISVPLALRVGTVVPFFCGLVSIFGARRSVFCTLVPVLGVQETSAKTTLLEATPLRTPKHLQLLDVSGRHRFLSAVHLWGHERRGFCGKFAEICAKNTSYRVRKGCGNSAEVSRKVFVLQ